MKLTKNFWISLALALLIFGGLQYVSRGVFADPDGFYHAKASQLLTEGRLHNTFPWLYYTTWNQGYADQHFLYHWLLTPFNTVDKLQISIVVFSLIFVVLFLLVLRKYKITHQWLWTILLLCTSADFLFRINLVKANTVSLALLCLIVLLVHGYHFQTSKKFKLWNLVGIALVSGIFVWTYGGFVCVPFLLAAYVAACVLQEVFLVRNSQNSNASIFQQMLKATLVASAPLLASITGIVVGLFAHPNSQHLIWLLFDQLFRTGLGAGINVPAGNEWNPFNVVWFVQSNILLLITWFIGFILLIDAVNKYFNKSSDQATLKIHDRIFTLTLWLQLTALGLVVLTLWHRRFVEYWVPFVVLASALTFQPFLEQIIWPQLKKTLQFWQMKVAIILLLAAVGATVFYNVDYTLNSLKNSESATVFQPASQWLKENSKSGDIVFNTQWDQFPQLFYWNDQNYYIVGLDPTFMYINNQDLYWQWRNVADDKAGTWDSPEEIHGIVAEQFHAKFIILDRNQNPNLYDYLTSLEAQRLFQESFVNDNTAVFSVIALQ